MTQEAVLETLNIAEKPEKLPLQRPTPKPIPFPHDSLGKLEAVVTAIHEVVQAPFVLCANSVLAATCLAVQGHADVELPIVGKPRPLSCFFVTIGATGERKSGVDALAVRAIEEKERALKEEYQSLLNRYRIKKDVWDKDRQKILGNNKEGYARDARENDLSSLGEEPRDPLKALLTFPEPTYQGLHKYLERGQASVGVFSAEGGQFIGGHAMRDENKMETAAGLNAFWDGSPLKRVRSGDGTSSLFGKRLSMHLMVQPEAALKLMTDRQMEDQGFLARMLVCYPVSTQGSRIWKEQTPEIEAAIDAFCARLRQILNTPEKMKEGQDNELDPRPLRLSTEARKLWIEYDAHLETQRGPNGYFSRIAGLANKLPEHAARLAGILALYEDLLCTEISSDHMQAGIKLAEYYSQEALRLKDMQAVDRDLMLAQRIMDWIVDKGMNEIPLHDIYQKAPITEVRNARRAREIMTILVDHGHVYQIDGGMVIDGIHRKEVWRVA